MYAVKFTVQYLINSDLFRITLPLCQNHTRALPKSHSDFHKITAWFSQHHWLIFTKSHSDFVKITIRLYQNHTPIFTKSMTDFHKKPQIVVLPHAVSKPPPPHCASCSSEGFSSFVTSLSGSPHCFCPCFVLKKLVLFAGSSCLPFHHFACLH